VPAIKLPRTSIRPKAGSTVQPVHNDANKEHAATPFLLPKAFQALLADVFLIGAIVFVREMREFQRFLTTLGYPYVDECKNPAYRLFLG